MIGKTELVIEIEAEPPSSDKPATITYTPVIEEHIATPGETGSPSKANAHNGEVCYVMIVFISRDLREEHVIMVFLSLDLREVHVIMVLLSLDLREELVIMVFLSLDLREEQVIMVFLSLDLWENK